MWRRIQAWWAYQRGMMLRFWGHRTVRRAYYRSAVEAFGRAIAFAPDHADAYLARGLIFWRELNSPEEAVADFTAVLDLRAENAEAYFYRGMAYQARGDYAAAADDLRAALRQGSGALWEQSAYRQLITIEAILETLPARFGGKDEALLPPGAA